MKKDCWGCMNMIPIGEGDHICWECKEGECTFILEDYTPTEDYFCCKGKKWEEL